MKPNELGFCLFYDWVEVLRPLDAETAFRIILALADYCKDGEKPDHLGGTEYSLFLMMKAQVDRSIERSQKGAEMANARWKSNSKAEEKQCTSNAQAMLKQCASNTTETETETETITETIIPPYNPPKGNAREAKRFVKPTVEEVTEYCTERGNSIDPQSFIDFYESKGWKIGSQPMKDWKAAVRTWEQRRKEEAPRQKPAQKPKSALEYGEKGKYGSFSAEDAFEAALKRTYGG